MPCTRNKSRLPKGLDGETMTNLLVMKEYLKHFYSKYEIYIQPVAKFLLAFVSLQMINSRLGFMGAIDHVAIVLVVALMCSFLPRTFIVLFSALFILLHLYEMGIECAIVALVLFLIMFLLYFRFSSKDVLAVVLTPICFAMKIPYVIPIACGLAGTPYSVVSVGCGIVTYYLVHYMSGNAAAIRGMGADDAATRLRYVLDGIVGNKTMVLMLAAFTITIVVVYSIRRLSVDYSWQIAILAGVLSDLMILLIGDLIYDTNISILGMIVGAVLAAAVGEVVMFLCFNVDYSRTERVQFEDDEYYYYVKAVPKITIAKPSKNVKRINTPQRTQSSSSVHKK